MHNRDTEQAAGQIISTSMLRVSENPPARPDRFASVRDMTGQWFVAHTKSRCEKALAWDLLHLNVAYFLPMVKRITFSGGRKRTGFSALFSGYLFFNGSDEDRQAVFHTDRLCAAHRVPQSVQFVDQIAAIEASIDAGLPIDVYPFAVVGKRVRVKAGPLAGVVGIIVARENITRLIIEVPMLGQNAAVPIDADLVELCE